MITAEVFDLHLIALIYFHIQLQQRQVYPLPIILMPINHYRDRTTVLELGHDHRVLRIYSASLGAVSLILRVLIDLDQHLVLHQYVSIRGKFRNVSSYDDRALCNRPEHEHHALRIFNLVKYWITQLQCPETIPAVIVH